MFDLNNMHVIQKSQKYIIFLLLKIWNLLMYGVLNQTLIRITRLIIFKLLTIRFIIVIYIYLIINLLTIWYYYIYI
jgi:hypothetical protein